ncbi:hypothetical protein CRV15_07690 [Streptomyces clavuligerus]|uniref:Uncharacterized protein n=1 Tax=Streptomyces clavuligerus TaxID=1901 RepID=B5GLG0_STRCL|nr:hypothetical protein [Streptomyces clavuligerus]AXU12726.1 hypothetical protein D1794_08265 [Streptomyces clavuligerus]EDY47156.1 hypothetical protein SSCG_00184 [Streptomyces clavuligerus]EFG09238.1 Hypothetical protein SCLAV_4163 [Streptomyces clavuligerus]QCS05510.1 hypothetical protein CRV15_07690 [Streptomyces clavuligerus]QPJ95122.1 hypothetical protein GE265_20225 [Streptomyces clavuligerus]
MAPGDKHQKKDVEAALKRAEKAGLKVTRKQNRHNWGFILCCPCDADIAVYCTPRSAGDLARDIDRFTRRHTNCA